MAQSGVHLFDAAASEGPSHSCGFHLERSRTETHRLNDPSDWLSDEVAREERRSNGKGDYACR